MDNLYDIDLLLESNLIEEEPSGIMLKHAVYAYRYLWAVTDWFQPITVDTILNVHKLLMEPAYLDEKYKGALRDINVTVGGRLCPSPVLVPALLDNFLLDWWDMDPTLAHVRFEKIHPFVDGNGRVGRILWMYHCAEKGLPPPEFSYEEKKEYYKLFTKH